MLAKAAATECNGVFFAVSCSDVGDEWMGGSEQLIKALYEKDSAQLFSYFNFRTVARARAGAGGGVQKHTIISHTISHTVVLLILTVFEI